MNDENANTKWSNYPDCTPNATDEWVMAKIDEEQYFLKVFMFLLFNQWITNGQVEDLSTLQNSSTSVDTRLCLEKTLAPL